MTKLAGVIDFDTTSLGDPAWDLATQLHCGIEFAQLVFHAYGRKDPGMWTRAQQLFQLRQLEGLDWPFVRATRLNSKKALRS